MIADVINEIYVAVSLGLYLVYVNEDHGGRVPMGCQNGSEPRFIMICDNPFFGLSPVHTRNLAVCICFAISSFIATGISGYLS